MRASKARTSLRHFAMAVTAVAVLALPSFALAHLERPSYWPDPEPDTSVSPPAGGEVPKPRSLKSAVTGKGPGEVRVVCHQGKARKSMNQLRRSVRKAKKKGFALRPSLGKEKLSKKKAKRLLRKNRKLAKQCEYSSVQEAVTDSGNNDRVVVMPGRYKEPDSREAPVNDPQCNPSMLQDDQEGNPTPSYEYQVNCPNDQNLIHIAGRDLQGEPLPEPRADRHGIPEQELGDCVRCNLQIEGSGVKPEDVILDAGSNYEKPRVAGSRPGGDLPVSECTSNENDNPCFGKHVVLRADRADGFVGRNFLLRGAKEHGFYTEETDGILLDRVKFFWNRDYGHLSFTTDHHMVKNCDGFGSGDAVVYPGAAPQTGEFRKESFYPESRYNTTIKKCDLHGSAMGYSGSMGNSVRVTKNRFYGNANGLTTDTLSAPGHPGFPADGMKIDRNWFYANNLDIYTDNPPFQALVPQPVGTGFFWPGNNDGKFENNWTFDNWGRGTMLISIPDAIAGTPDGQRDPDTHCPTDNLGEDSVSTSCDNRYAGNRMGEVPPSFKPHKGLTKFGNQTSLLGGGGPPKQAPNGLDFWWDEAAVNTGNCWPDNTGPDGTRDSLRASPEIGPSPGENVPMFLPERCDDTSTGNPAGYGPKVLYLLTCFAQWESKELDMPGCDWWDTPPQPTTSAARASLRAEDRILERLSRSEDADRVEEWVRELSGDVGFGPSH